MVDSKLMKRFLVWIDRIKAEFNNTIDFETFVVKHSAYFRIGCGWLDYEKLVPADGDISMQNPEIAGKSHVDNPQRNFFEGRSETIMGSSQVDDGIVRAAWQHAEVGRNDQLAFA